MSFTSRLPVHHPTLTFLAIPKGINLQPLQALRELELSTFLVQSLPYLLRSINSGSLQSIRLFVLVHQFEGDLDRSTRKLWARFDIELCALVNRVQALCGYSGQVLKVKLVDLDPTTPVWMVEEIATVYLPRSKKHRYIDYSYSVG